MSDGTKLSQLPSAQNLADTDLMYAVEGGTSSKATVEYLRNVFVGAETTAREAADTALGGRIDGKQDALTFDNAPTENSNNPVKSGGIYTALADKANTSDLAAVATSGAYSDLTGTPTIPTVEANPSSTATDTLTKIEIDSTVYSISGGGEEITGEASGAVASFSDGADNVAVKSLVVGIEPVQSGSGDPSPSNIRPISGWSSVNVNVDGKNLFDNANLEIGNYDINGNKSANPNTLRTINYIPIKNGTKYIINSTWSSGGSYNGDIFEYDINKNFLRRSFWGQTSKTKNFGNDVYYINLTTRQEYGTTPKNDIYILAGETDSGYVAYDTNSHVVPISWQTEAGTVYGGELNVTTGELTVDRASVDLTTLNWEFRTVNNVQRLCSNTISNIETPNTDAYVPKIIASCYQKSPISNIGDTDGRIGIGSSQYSYGKRLIVNDSRITQISDVETVLANQTAVYNLATPTTVQLTPTEVKTLLGNNNIWADSGDSDVVYVRDLNLAFNELWNKVNS